MIHIGKVIEKILRDQGRTVTWFARSLYCDRTNVYKIFQRESVDSEMLYRISKILSHDFFKYYSQELEVEAEENPVYLKGEEEVKIRNGMYK